MAFYFYFVLASSYKDDTRWGSMGEYYMGMYTGGTRRESVECSRIRATTLVVLWRR